MGEIVELEFSERERLRRWARKNRAKEPCPGCGSDAALPIVWGLPGPEVFELAEVGEITLGGCVIFGKPAKWACKECGTQWPQDARFT